MRSWCTHRRIRSDCPSCGPSCAARARATVHQAVPPLPAETVATELIGHITTLLTALDAVPAGDPDAPVDLRAAAAPMPGVAAVLASGITQDRQLR